jgi:3-methylfumaryl-CoA hydratase
MSGFDPLQFASWCPSIGREEKRRELICPEPLRRFALAIGADPDVENHAPPLAHWAFFLPEPSDNNIGPDGHPWRGGFMPEISLPRRMFAASAMEFHAPLVLGQDASLASRIADVSHKQGRSGDLVFVEVERIVAQGGTIVIQERQNFVYREIAPPAPMPEPLPTPPIGESWSPDEVNLFRFSAATFNGHRIHYDAPYARDAERYPALVVHGPFTAAKLAARAMRGGPLRTFAFKALVPLFVGQAISLRDHGENAVEAVRCDGAIAMRAEFSRD